MAAGSILMKLKDFFGYEDVRSFKTDWDQLTPQDKEELTEAAAGL